MTPGVPAARPAGGVPGRAVPDAEAFGLRLLLRTVFKRRRSLRWLMAAFFLASLLGTFSTPDTFVSNATLMLRLGRESVTLDPTSDVGHVLPVFVPRASEIKSDMEILKSETLANETISEIGEQEFSGRPNPVAVAINALLGRLRPSRAQPAESTGEMARAGLIRQFMGKWYQVDMEKDTNIIKLSFTAQDPVFARRVLESLIHHYMSEHIKAYYSPKAVSFFDEQGAVIHGQLAKMREDLVKLKKRYGLASPEAATAALAGAVEVLRRDLMETKAKLQDVKAGMESTRRSLSRMPADLLVKDVFKGSSDNLADTARKRLPELVARRAELACVMTAKNPDIVSLDAQIARIEAFARDSDVDPAKLVAIRLAPEAAEAASLETRTMSLTTYLKAYEAKLDEMIGVEARVRDLEQEIAIKNDAYKSYREKGEQARIDQSLEQARISNISVIQPPTLAPGAVRPKNFMSLVRCALVAAIAAFSAIFTMEYFDRTLSTPQDVERVLGRSPIACVPDVAREYKEGGWHPLSHRTMNSRQVRKYYEMILNHMASAHAGVKESPPIFTLIGGYAGDGASTMTLGLAQTIAEWRKARVLVVDADFRHPSLHGAFHQKRSPGVADIAGPDAGAVVARPTHVPGVDFIPVGRAADDAHLAIASQEFFGGIERIKGDYDYVFIDAGAFSDKRPIGALLARSSAVFWVLGAERMRREAASHMLAQLERCGATRVEIIFNRRRYYIPEWLYRRV
jgi:uncharacterized protein involved in exopolysaccharide biosynthesis/Mrp family chromosome partitioning ATPase